MAILTTGALCLCCGESWTVPYATEGEVVAESVHDCPNARPRRHLSVVR